jgi:hypothetical protein
LIIGSAGIDRPTVPSPAAHTGLAASDTREQPQGNQQHAKGDDRQQFIRKSLD